MHFRMEFYSGVGPTCFPLFFIPTFFNPIFFLLQIEIEILSQHLLNQKLACQSDLGAAALPQLVS